MRKIVITAVFALLCTAQVLDAVPARQRKYRKLQPNGTTITLQRHGDEFYHWTTDENGTVVALNKEGIYVPSSMPEGEEMGGRAAAEAAAAAIRTRRAAMPLTRAGGVRTYHFPVILVEFSDVKFRSATAHDDFDRLVNEVDYSDNGATGSVHDYYWENSMGTFDAQFDVFGPYTYNDLCANNPNQADAAKILWNIIRNHDSEVDWSQYDNDNDGYVDMVFLYYAGWNQAEGQDGTIWPHKWDFYSAGTSTSMLDGKRFSTYACTSELKGSSYDGGAPQMCGIGTCAHEFSHTQGLPDFYDVNYEMDGSALGTGSFDIMCSGSYNNEGRTPPYFSAEERIMMGWLDGYAELPASGTVTIPAVNTNFAYKMPTANTSGDGEYFIFECRSGTGWDSYVGPGMLVYHVDKSTKYSNSFHQRNSGSNLGTFNGKQLWDSHRQYLNMVGTHPYFYIVPAADQSSLNYGGNIATMPFPGGRQVTWYIPIDWDGHPYSLFSDIAFDPSGSSGPVVTMTRASAFRGVIGQVTNLAGEPIPGAKVGLYRPRNVPPTSSPDNIQLISGRISGNLIAQTTTDSEGHYSFELPNYTGASLDIEVAAGGYITSYETISSDELPVEKDFKLRDMVNEPLSPTLYKSPTMAPYAPIGYGDTETYLGAIRFSQEELQPYVGCKILRVGFLYYNTNQSIGAVYGIVDAGDSRNLVQVSSPKSLEWNEVDFTDKNLRIEPQKEYYFGYALENCNFGFPLVFDGENDVQPGGAYISVYSPNTTTWKTSVDWSGLDGFGNILVYVELDTSSPIDYNTIANPGYGNYTVGDEFALVLNEATGARKPGTAIQWFFDDEPVSGSSVPLKYPGRHVVEARFTTTEGKTKVVELEIEVQP